MPLETAVAKVSGGLHEPAELIDSMDGSQVGYIHPFASAHSFPLLPSLDCKPRLDGQ